MISIYTKVWPHEIRKPVNRRKAGSEVGEGEGGGGAERHLRDGEGEEKFYLNKKRKTIKRCGGKGASYNRRSK